MKLKNIVILGIRLMALTIAMFVSLSVASSVVGLDQGSTLAPEQARRVLAATLAVCCMYAVVLAWPILRSRWAGWKLVATVALLYYGVNTFMSQIESAVFLPHALPQGMLHKLFLDGALVAVLIAPAAVLVMGRLKPGEAESPTWRLVMPLGEWAWKLAASTVLYMTLYFGFGLLAWMNPALREFYAGGMVIPDWMPLVQIPRGLLWTALALPVIRMMKGAWWEAGLAVGLLFAVLTGAALLIPNNPIMPDSVRLTHCAELLSSNFIFGMLSTALMVWRPATRRVAQAAAA